MRKRQSSLPFTKPSSAMVQTPRWTRLDVVQGTADDAVLSEASPGFRFDAAASTMAAARLTRNETRLLSVCLERRSQTAGRKRGKLENFANAPQTCRQSRKIDSDLARSRPTVNEVDSDVEMLHVSRNGLPTALIVRSTRRSLPSFHQDGLPEGQWTVRQSEEERTATQEVLPPSKYKGALYRGSSPAPHESSAAPLRSLHPNPILSTHPPRLLASALLCLIVCTNPYLYSPSHASCPDPFSPSSLFLFSPCRPSLIPATRPSPNRETSVPLQASAFGLDTLQFPFPSSLRLAFPFSFPA
jgi:hypothetical protein